MLDPLVLVIKGFKFFNILQSRLKGHPGTKRDQLGNLINLWQRDLQNPANIPQGAASSHSTKGNNLGHMVLAILGSHIFNNLTPTLNTKINVNIRHRDPLIVQKSFK